MTFKWLLGHGNQNKFYLKLTKNSAKPPGGSLGADSRKRESKSAYLSRAGQPPDSSQSVTAVSVVKCIWAQAYIRNKGATERKKRRSKWYANERTAFIDLVHCIITLGQATDDRAAWRCCSLGPRWGTDGRMVDKWGVETRMRCM